MNDDTPFGDIFDDEFSRKDKPKRHHPSLEEVLNEDADYEWLSLNIIGFYLGDYADSNWSKGDISSPVFYIHSSFCESEYGTYYFKNATINILLSTIASIENLEGEYPLGSCNYFDSEKAFINIPLKPQIYNNLLTVISNDINLLTIRIALPIWKDENIKCLPILKYQVMYKYEDEI